MNCMKCGRLLQSTGDDFVGMMCSECKISLIYQHPMSNGGTFIYCTEPTRRQVIEVLERYNDLLKEEYQDSDLWDIISQTTDKFLLKYYPKID